MQETAIHPSYAHFDPDNYDNLSLCLDCAKHPSLKRFIGANSVEGPVCGVCQHVSAPYLCCDLGQKDHLSNILKALIRLYYNEFQYNGHWGGDHGPEGFLVKDNPILEHQTTLERTRIPDRSSEFLHDLLSQETYPDPDKGIWLYAGHDEEVGRLMQLSLTDSKSQHLEALESRLAKENYFEVEPDLLNLIDAFAGRITRTVVKGARYFRARIGVQAQFLDMEAASFFYPIVRQPYSGPALGAPPPQLTTAGRLNRSGVAFLYLASDAATAACEVRPHPGHFLSVGEFESTRDLTIATFDADIIQFAQSDRDLRLYHFILSVDKVIASPVVPENAKRYTITQLIAECLRQKGFDGISFKSSIAGGQNLCVFKPDSFVEVEGSTTVLEVKTLSYGMEPAPAILKQTSRHSRIP